MHLSFILYPKGGTGISILEVKASKLAMLQEFTFLGSLVTEYIGFFYEC
jgi:hypothetical protein